MYALVIYVLLSQTSFEVSFKEVRGSPHPTYLSCSIVADRINQDSNTPEVAVCLRNEGSQRR